MAASRLRSFLLVVLCAVCCNSVLAQAWQGAPSLLETQSPHPKTVLNAAALTGLWYAPSQSGHGFALTFDTAGHVAATWYVYQGTRQVWLIGSGTLDGNVARLPTVITAGGNFPPNFNPGAVALTDWGTLTLNIQSCDRITVSWESSVSGFGSGSVDVQPLIVAGALPCAVTVADDRPDACAAASRVDPNGQYAARIDPEGDVDFYRLDLTQRGILTARSRSGLDMLGTIHDANCNPIAQNDDTSVPGNSNDYDFSATALLSPGTYYVSARAYSTEVTGDYALVLSYDTNVPADDFGDTCLGAPSLAIGASVSGRIDPSLDVDYFRVDLTGQTALLASITDVTDGLDTVLAIRDANCQVLVENDDFDSQASAASLVLGAGTYYVSVRAYDTRTMGGYTLALSRAANNDDHGDFCTVATPIGANASATGQIGSAGDWDFFAVDLPAPGTLSVQTSGITTLDPALTLYEGSCAPEAYDDDGGPGLNSYLTYSPGPGRYYFRVRAADNALTGGYTVATTFVASTPEVDEHGDDCAHATPVGPAGNVFGYINSAGDRDFFRFDTDAGQFIVARAYADSPIAIAVLDSACQVRGENAGPDEGNGNGYPISVPGTPGTYYIRVRSTDGSTGLYQFYYGASDTAGLAAAKALAPAPAPARATNAAAAPLPAAEFRSAQATPVLSHPIAREPRAKAIANPSALSGLWYDPAQSGQGVQITFDSNGTVALTWYVYQGTRQVWLIGSAPLQGNHVTLPMYVSSGADFLPAFDPATVTLTPWGNVTLDVRACNAIAMSWAPTLAGYTPGSMNLAPLIVAGGLTCVVSSETDDHGDDCAHADPATLDGAVGGRIDPTGDVDVFRVNVGGAGTLTVQSSGSSTLNPTGTLLDGSCNAIASNDDAAGREFSISRAVGAGTYYVRVASSGGASIGDYTLGTSFAPASGGGTSAANLTLENDLVYDVDYKINGGAPIRVGAGARLTQNLSLTGTLNVSFALVGAVNAIGEPVGDLLGGTFDPVANPSGSLAFVVDSEVGAQRYFAPVISNKTQTSFLVGVNMGRAAENRCNCTVGASAQNVRVGYYLFLSNSNVRAYAVGSNYGGAYAYWGDDSGGGGRPLFGVPLVNILESPSGRVLLKYIP